MRGKRMVSGLGSCLFAYNYAIFDRGNKIQWCSTKVLADGNAVFCYRSDFHGSNFPFILIYFQLVTGFVTFKVYFKCYLSAFSEKSL